MEEVKKTFRINSELYNDIEQIANENNATITFIVEQALKQYRDKEYMDKKATIINEDIIEVMKSLLNISERKINNKTNSYLSELAIQTTILTMVVADGLEIYPDKLENYRKIAIEFLQERQRILRLDELIE